MAKDKTQRTLVEQTLNKAKIEHQGLQINALDSLTEEFDTHNYKRGFERRSNRDSHWLPYHRTSVGKN